MVVSNNEAIVYDQINKTLDRVISGDIFKYRPFYVRNYFKISGILYSVADMDAFNF